MKKTTKLKTDTPTPARRPKGRGNPVSEGERAAVQALALAGVSGREIAKNIGRHEKTVYRILDTKEFEDAKQIARSVLASHATDVAHAWVEAAKISAQKGGHEAARDLLQGIGAVEKPGVRKGDPGKQFTVRIGMVLPGLGLSEPPALTVAAQVSEGASDEDSTE